MGFPAGNYTEAAGRCEQSAQLVAVAPRPLPHTDLPLYYIQRPGITHHTASGSVTTPGPNVPLIAADQLPPWIGVVGIPRELSREQAMSLSSLGIVPMGSPYEVHLDPAYLHAPEILGSQADAVAKACSSQRAQLVSRQSAEGHYGGHTPKDGAVVGDRPLVGLHQRPASPAPVRASRENPYPMMYPPRGFYDRKGLTIRRRGEGEHPAERLLRASHELTLKERKVVDDSLLLSVSSDSSTLIASSPSTSPPSSSSSTSPTRTTMATQKVNTARSAKEKENQTPSAPKTNKADKENIYCRNWCRRGTCRFGEACFFRHEMPLTVRGLREAGLKDYPSWWATHLELMSQHVRGVRAAAISAAAAANANSISFPSGRDQKTKKEGSRSVLAPPTEQKQHRDVSAYVENGHINIYDHGQGDNHSKNSGGSGNRTMPASSKDEHAPQPVRTSCTTINDPHKKTSTHDPGPSLRLIKAESAADKSLAITASGPSASARGAAKRISFPAQDTRNKARALRTPYAHDIRRSAARFYGARESGMSTSTSTSTSRGRGTQLGPGEQTRTQTQTQIRRPSSSPDDFERELAAAAAEEEERWRREQGRVPPKVEAEIEAKMDMKREVEGKVGGGGGGVVSLAGGEELKGRGTAMQMQIQVQGRAQAGGGEREEEDLLEL
ncbi:hypothetical protein F5Y14DRAFT_41707 [Nemania sp. NC0429]|nr:hypothetical protein F5Y14DRAFT_41707 [Nemania sp. NC0429]